jgi:hypothetical protein
VNMAEAKTTAEFLQSTYGRNESVAYSEMQHHGEMLGIDSLVDSAMLLESDPTIEHLQHNPLPVAEVDLQLQLAKLYLSLPKALSAELAYVFANSMRKTREEFSDEPSQFQARYHIPGTVNEVHAAYTKGKNCILKHLPHPLVDKLDNKHTYCPLPMILADALEHETSLDCCWDYVPDNHEPINVKNVFDTKNRLEVLQQYNHLHHGDANLTVSVTLWSDDHDPNGTKDNRRSIWTLMVTIATSDCNLYSTLNTYPISISTNGASYDIVFKCLADDLCMLW